MNSIQFSNYPDISRMEMMDFIPLDAKKILDVGCNKGGFGRALIEHRKAEVWGVEPNPEAASIASKSLSNVYNAFFSVDLDLPNDFFDVVIFNDVLEHMPDPWSAIKLATQLIKNDGCIVASIPNLRHIDNLLHILQERDFRYEKMGIRDKTHLRFFTRKSILKLFEDCNLEVIKIEGIKEDVYQTPIRKIAYFLFSKNLDDTRHIQYVVVAKKRLYFTNPM